MNTGGFVVYVRKDEIYKDIAEDFRQHLTLLTMN